MPFQLQVQITGFGPSFGGSLNGARTESLKTADIIRAAIVAGHPDRASLDSRIIAWRTASIRLALEISPLPPSIPRNLLHPKAWKSLEPSEKAGLQNILGNTVTKLLSERLLDAPRMWFLDVYKKDFSINIPKGQRPDFFAKTKGGQWLSLEAKGRANAPSTKSLGLAKTQAKVLKKIKGSKVAARVVCWTMSRRGVLEARLHDPEGVDEDKQFTLDVEDTRLLKDYYGPVETLMAASEPVEYGPRLTLFRFLAGDFLIGLHPIVQEALHIGEPGSLLARFDEGQLAFEPVGNVTSGPDGIIVVPGRSWPE